MRTLSRLNALAVAALFLGCAARPTRVTTDWREPTTQALRLQRTVAFFPGEDAQLRRQVEDRLARRLPGGVASYTLVSDEQLAAADTQAIRAALNAARIDGVVVLRLVSVESQSSGRAVPATGTPAENLWAYLRRTPRAALTPGRQTTITMESRVYSVPDARLVWTGHSETFNPLSVKELVNMLVDGSVSELQRQGLLP
jgi:hypothetical protein